MEHRLLLCVSPGRTRAFILGLLSADRNDCNQTFQGEETENVAHRLIVTDFAGYENEGLAVDSIPLMYRNGLNSLFFARSCPRVRYRELNFTVTEWQQQGQLISTGPGGLLPARLAWIIPGGLSLGKSLFEPRKQVFDETAKFCRRHTDQSGFQDIPRLQTLTCRFVIFGARLK